MGTDAEIMAIGETARHARQIADLPATTVGATFPENYVV
jgi:hypothetical protein